MGKQIVAQKLTATQIERGTNLPPRLESIGREIEAKVAKFQVYETKASDFAASIQALLNEAKGYCNEAGFAAFRRRFCPSLGKSRAYEMLAIASGRKTLAQVKAAGAARQAKYQARLKAVAAVHSVSDGKPSTLRQFTASVLELVLLTATTKPAEFRKTTAPATDLKQLAAFLRAVAEKVA